MNRLLITGAAGGLGRVMRDRLAPLATTLRLADITPITDARPNEEVVTCDLKDAAAVDAMVAGCDGILHLGGISVETPFAPILDANIVGVYNLYEAAHAHGQPRIIFASSNHTVGFWEQSDYLADDCTYRPDTLYGVSKIFGEAIAQMYFEKFGQETARVRIGSCFERPADHRQLGSWLSYDDFTAMIEACFKVEKLGCPVIWGASANSRGWWDNSHLGWLGWQAKDNAERFADQLEGPAPDPESPLMKYQGGTFTQHPIFKA